MNKRSGEVCSWSMLSSARTGTNFTKPCKCHVSFLLALSKHKIGKILISKCWYSLSSICPLHHDSPNLYLLEESYAIKGGPKITRIIGSWSYKTGLTIKTANLLERRKNLNGIELRDSVLPYAKISKPVYDDQGNVIKSGGIFQARYPNSAKIISVTKI